MNEKLMQKMFIIFESIIKNEGATALTNERIKKCCEENCVDYEEFIASVFEEVWSVIGSHSENTGDVLLSELSSKNLEEVSGGAGFFQRGTASALAVLSLCGATQLPASAVKEKDRQVLLQKRVASRHLQKRSEADSVIEPQTAQNIAKYCKIFIDRGAGFVFDLLAYEPKERRSIDKRLRPWPNDRFGASVART